MFSTDITVPAFSVTEGTVIHAAPCSDCNQPTVARTVAHEHDARGPMVLITFGCACGASGRATLREEHVLTLCGTVALI